MNYTKNNIPPSFFIAFALLTYIVLFAAVITSRTTTCFDEQLFIHNMALFNEFGLSKTFLVQMVDQAPGPLYQLVHYPLQYFTHLEAPAIRVVNMVLFFVVIFFTWLNIRLTNPSLKKEVALAWASTLVFVPVVWQVAGLALTEMPAMAASSASIYLLLLAIQKLQNKNSAKASLLSFTAGVLLGFAILGRSPFLLIGVASLALFTYPRYHSKKIVLAMAYLLPALIMAIPIFFTWKGLVPPHQQYIGHGFSIWHGFLAFAYMGIVTLLAAPQWFVKFRWQWPLFALGYLLLFLINYHVLGLTYYTLGFTIKRFISPSLFQYYPFLIAPALLIISLFFIGSCFYRLFEKSGNNSYVFLLLSGLLLLASCAGITHLFSTRYVAQASPVFVLLFAGYDRFGYSRMLRLGIGALIGALSLYTYLVKF